MEKVSLSANLVNALAQYLYGQKYVDVFQLIQGLESEIKDQMQVKPETPEEPKPAAQ